jgi:hypothetical protein
MNSMERAWMRQTALLVTATIGLAFCCAIILIDARAQLLSDAWGLDFFGQQGEMAAVAAPPHHMRGWAHSPPRALWWPAQP